MVRSRNTAKNRQVVHVLGFPKYAGTALPGVTCEKLFIDPNLPYFLYFAKSDASGSHYQARPGYLIPYRAAWTGIRFMVQSLWDETVTNQTMLTYAEDVYFLRTPPLKKRWTYYQYIQAQKSLSDDSGVNQGEAVSNSLILYTQ